ncbi:MAG TPA: GIY-YIG nuclease family protein [Terriglobales bacterium]|nr:GIY-YIG nuclease family protein [Terriglobales bacterium]
MTDALKNPGVYVLYRDDLPYYIGKTGKPLLRRLSTHALKPNSPRYNFWNYFSAFEINDSDHRDEIEAILISAMPTANSSRPKFVRKKLDRGAAKLLNNVQALMLTGMEDTSGEKNPEAFSDDEED